jgi:heme/copper-type cytochrome/quinol oxidase subunit 4
MTEIEVPMEKVQEDILHQAQHSHDNSNFMMKGALLSAILAVLAAISALMAGHFANEAMLEQLKSSDAWSYYQAKGIKASIAEIKQLVNPKDSESLQAKIEGYKKEQEEIKKEADENQHESQIHLHKHETLASAVTFFQIAIALTAISVLTRKRRFMSLALILGLVGTVLMGLGLRR